MAQLLIVEKENTKKSYGKLNENKIPDFKFTPPPPPKEKKTGETKSK